MDACGNNHKTAKGLWVCTRPSGHEGPHHGTSGGDPTTLITWTLPEGE